MSCLIDLERGGLFGEGVHSFGDSTAASGFIRGSRTTSQYPLKIVCRQWGILGFAGVITLYALLTAAGCTATKRVSNQPLQILTFGFAAVLVITGWMQIIKNILPLAVLPSFALPFMGWGWHAAVFSLTVCGAICGLFELSAHRKIASRESDTAAVT